MILVGRTGLDASLRLDPDVELVRAASPVLALGELADPIDGESPRTVRVIVAEGAVPAGRERVFLAAVQRINPQARVLAMRGQGVMGGADTSQGLFHGVIHTSLTPAELRAVLGREDGKEPTSASAAVPARGDRDVAVTVTEPASDLKVLTELVRGGGVAGVLAAALEELRVRTGVGDVAFSDTAPPGIASTAVRHAGQTLGFLASSELSEHDLAGESGRLALILALARQHEQLRQAAFTDELTGAWNRRYFQRFLAAGIEHAKRERRHIVVMVFDIDNFKHYNDRYGHAAGDEILAQTVQLLSSVIRPSDRVCRIGGDEFAVIFSEPRGPREQLTRDDGACGGGDATLHRRLPADIMQIAARFQRQVAEHRFPKLADEAPGRLTISGGLAVYPWDGRSVDELLEFADKLALQGKRQGKNALVFGPEG